MVERKDYDKSTFNMALRYLERIDELLYKCSIFNIDGEYKQWNDTLTALYIAVATFMDSKEKKSQLTYIQEIDKAFSNGNIVIIKKRLALYEIFLRTVCNNHDLLLPEKPDAGEAAYR